MLLEFLRLLHQFVESETARVRLEHLGRLRCFEGFIHARTHARPPNPSPIWMEGETTLQPLRSIVPAAQNNINAKFIVVDKGRVSLEGQQYKTCLALVADETAAVHFQLWGDECEAVEAGDILVLRNGIFSYSRNTLLLRAGKRGTVEKVGEFTMAFVETPNLSEMRWAPDPRAANKYVQQAVVSAYSRIFPPLH